MQAQQRAGSCADALALRCAAPAQARVRRSGGLGVRARGGIEEEVRPARVAHTRASPTAAPQRFGAPRRAAAAPLPPPRRPAPRRTPPRAPAAASARHPRRRPARASSPSPLTAPLLAARPRRAQVYIDKAPDSLLRADGQDSGMRAKFEKMIREKQNEICAAIEALDGSKFREDSWTRPGGGGGISRVLQGGNVRRGAGGAARGGARAARCCWILYSSRGRRAGAKRQRGPNAWAPAPRAPLPGVGEGGRQRLRRLRLHAARRVPRRHRRQRQGTHTHSTWRTRSRMSLTLPLPLPGAQRGACAVLRCGHQQRDAPAQPDGAHHAFQLPLFRN